MIQSRELKFSLVFRQLTNKPLPSENSNYFDIAIVQIAQFWAGHVRWISNATTVLNSLCTSTVCNSSSNSDACICRRCTSCSLVWTGPLSKSIMTFHQSRPKGHTSMNKSSKLTSIYERTDKWTWHIWSYHVTYCCCTVSHDNNSSYKNKYSRIKNKRTQK